MLQFEGWKKLVVILITVLGIVYAAPNLMPDDDDTGGSFLPGQKINLGLDLQGARIFFFVSIWMSWRRNGLKALPRQFVRNFELKKSGSVALTCLAMKCG